MPSAQRIAPPFYDGRDISRPYVIFDESLSGRPAGRPYQELHRHSMADAIYRVPT